MSDSYARPWILLAATASLLSLAGCAVPDFAEGIVSFHVQDAPTDDFSSIFVTFSRVEVHRSGEGAAEVGDTTTTAPTNGTDTTSPTNATGDEDHTADENDTEETGGEWITIVDTAQTVDLKNFSGDARAFLGSANVSVGKYTQIRVHIDEAYGLRASDGTRENFTIPSGVLKIVRPWNVREGETTDLTLDFDLNKSIVATGQGKYHLKPVTQLKIEEGATTST